MDIVELQSKIDKLNENKAIAERGLTFIQNEIAKEEAIRESVKREIDIARAELGGFKDKLSENSKAIAEVSLKKVELEAKNEFVESEIKEKTIVLNDILRKIDFAKAELKDTESAKAKAVLDAELVIEGIAKKVVSSAKQEKELIAEISKISYEISGEKALLAKLKEELEDANEKRIAEFKKCEIAEANRVMIEKEIEKLRADAEVARKDIELSQKEKEEAKKIMAEAKAVRLRMEEKAKKAGI
jgi:chromosome segregation ATPase